MTSPASTIQPNTTVPKVASSLSSLEVAQLAAKAGLDKNATNVQIIYVADKVDYADYLVVMTGSSDRNVAAIARGVDADLNRANVRSLALEGLSRGVWVLIDFVDVVVHVFQVGWREEYDIDGLWMDAPRVPVDALAETPASI